MQCLQNPSPKLVEKPFELLGLINDVSRSVVGMSVANHELEIVSESISVGVVPFVKLELHCSQIHRKFDEVKVSARA